MTGCKACARIGGICGMHEIAALRADNERNLKAYAELADATIALRAERDALLAEAHRRREYGQQMRLNADRAEAERDRWHAAVATLIAAWAATDAPNRHEVLRVLDGLRRRAASSEQEMNDD